MARNDYGQVEIELGGETVTLEPTLLAMQKIDRTFGSLRDAIDQCQRLSLSALTAVIAAGSGMDQKEAKALDEKVFQAGVAQVAASITEYLFFLLNPTGRDSDGEEGERSGKA